jgi:hypothetical protein
MAFKAGELLEVQSFKKHLGEDNLKVRSPHIVIPIISRGGRFAPSPTFCGGLCGFASRAAAEAAQLPAALHCGPRHSHQAVCAAHPLPRRRRRTVACRALFVPADPFAQQSQGHQTPLHAGDHA